MARCVCACAACASADCCPAVLVLVSLLSFLCGGRRRRVQANCLQRGMWERYCDIKEHETSTHTTTWKCRVGREKGVAGEALDVSGRHVVRARTSRRLSRHTRSVGGDSLK
jgi:hypothetical protein